MARQRGFLRRFAAESRSKATGISREALDYLLKYPYEGNVRELENLIHRAVVLARGPLITTADLPLHVPGLKAESPDESGTFVERVARFERQLIDDAMSAADGVQTQAARRLGMSERHLRYKLRKYST